MQKNRNTWHLRACLGAVALMLTAPFLMAHHYNPIPSFYPEWVAVALSLFALSALFHANGRFCLEIPEISLIPAGLILIAALQYLLQADALTDRLLMFGCYLVWTVFLIILGRRLTQIFGIETLAHLMATAILVGALMEALTGGIQLFGIARLPWIFPALGGGLRGNLAQPNNFADYLWLGIAAALYLRSRDRLSTAATGAALLLLLPFAVLSGSRSIWLYAAGVLLLSLLWTQLQRNKAAAILCNWSLGALIGSIFFQLAFTKGWIPFPDDISTAGDRLTQNGSYDPFRLILWRIALDSFLENPGLGAGFGQYNHQFHTRVLDLMPAHLPGLPEHAHNIFLHLLAELGIGAGLLLVVFGGRWIFGLLRAPRTPEIWWMAASILIMGIHSNLEYPLWYGFFLGIAALLAGAGSRNNRVLALGRTAPYALTAILTLGTLALHNLYENYSLLEDTANGRLTAESGGDPQTALEGLAGHAVFRSYALLAAIHLLPVNEDRLEAKLGDCQRTQRFSASSDIVFKCAHLLSLAGQEAAAQLALRRAVAAYPDKAQRVLQQWRERRAEEPAIAKLLAAVPPNSAILP